MIHGPLTAAQIATGDQLWHCPRRRGADLTRVTAVNRRHNRWVIRYVDGPLAGQETAVFVRELFTDDTVNEARECLRRDREIAGLDAERPVDQTTWQAIIVCSMLASGTREPDADEIRGLMRRLGRPDSLEALHPTAHRHGWQVFAPDFAFVDAYRQFAQDNPKVIEERAAEIAERHVYEHEREAAVAMVRRWAQLPPLPRGAASESNGDDPGRVVVLEALLETAADLLDDLGRGDAALRLRKAAWPHRFAPR